MLLSRYLLCCVLWQNSLKLSFWSLWTIKLVLIFAHGTYSVFLLLPLYQNHLWTIASAISLAAHIHLLSQGPCWVYKLPWWPLIIKTCLFSMTCTGWGETKEYNHQMIIMKLLFLTLLPKCYCSMFSWTERWIPFHVSFMYQWRSYICLILCILLSCKI